jgi:hypothetical protein
LIVIIALTPRTSFSKDNFRKDNDSTEVDEDTSGNYAQSLLDDQNDENDRLDSIRENYYSYGLFGKIGYTSDMQYRGYQGAVAQSAFIPGLFFNHPLGFKVLLNVYSIKGSTVPWGELEVGALYTRTFYENFSIGLSLTHYTFYDTSEISQQGIDGIAGLNLSYDFSLFNAGTSFNISFGDQTDYSISFDLSKRIDIAKSPNLQCCLEPGFSGVYGTESLLNERIIMKNNPKKIMVNKVLTTANNVLSVLSYQLSVPLTVELGRFIITPQYDYIIPLNQPPFTDSIAFGFFTINVSVKIF